MGFRITTRWRWKTIFAIPLALLLTLAACGYQGGGGSNFGDTSGKNSKTGGKNGQNPATNPNIPSRQQEQQCPGLTLAMSIQYACANFFGQYADEIETACFQALNGVYDQRCQGLQNRIARAAQACRGDFTAFRDYLPGDCRSVVDGLLRR